MPVNRVIMFSGIWVAGLKEISVPLFLITVYKRLDTGTICSLIQSFFEVAVRLSPNYGTAASVIAIIGMVRVK